MSALLTSEFTNHQSRTCVPREREVSIVLGWGDSEKCAMMQAMSRRIDLSLVLACYNEETLLTESVKRILATLENSRLSFEIVFVDDASSDATVELIKKACQHRQNFRAIFHPVNLGRGRTVADGIRQARGKVVGYIDIDCEVSPVYIPEMVDTILKNWADVVIGQRIYRTTFPSIVREVLSRGYRKLADAMVGTGGLDTEAGYKFFRRQKILPILSKAKHPHWFWDTEMMVLAKRKGLHVQEVPVLFTRRNDKRSSVRVLPDMLDYLVSLWRLRRRLG